MKRTALIAGAFLLLGGAVRAQEDSLEKINKDVNQIFSKAKKPEDFDSKALASVIDRAMDLAVDHKGDATGFQAYQLAINLTGSLRGDDAKVEAIFTEAMDALIESFLNDDKMAAIVMRTLQSPPAESLKKKADEYFTWIARDTKNDSVKCACEYTELEKSATGALSDKDSKALIAKFEALKKKYGKVSSPSGGTWDKQIDERLADLKLIGSPAAEIAAKDLDGVDFKLSDYRGKVVLLDFWGMW